MSNMEVGAYFYPLTTQCPEKNRRTQEVGEAHGMAWRLSAADETYLAQFARPLFDGHQQPMTYCLDEHTTHWDDGDEAAIDRQITLAQDAGLKFFIFDSYEGTKQGVPTVESERPLQIFRKLVTGRGLRYAKMQTFASPRAMLPLPRDLNYYEPNRLYDLCLESVRFIVDTCVMHDWENPDHLLINDRPYMSLFVPDITWGTDSKMDLMGELITGMREYAVKKYKIDPYIVGSIRNLSQAQELTNSGIEALTGYALLPIFGDDVPPIQDYSELLTQRKIEWDKIKDINVFVPPAVVGWDASPRGKSLFQLGGTVGCSYAPIVVNSTPESFEGMLRDSLSFVDQNVPQGEKYGIICAWNEITEGAAVLPRLARDGTLDTSYLNVIRKVIDEYKNG